MAASALEPDGLRQLMTESAGSAAVGVVDCRPFTAFNAAHVDGAVNVHCPPIVRRRAGAGLIPATSVVRSTEALADLTAGRCRAVVVYDERSVSVDELDVDSLARLSLGSLAAVVASSTPLYLLRGRSSSSIQLLRLYTLPVFTARVFKGRIHGS